MKLIDKDALVAEIEKRKEALETSDGRRFHSLGDQILWNAFNSVQDVIKTLEIKDADSENKWIDCLERMPEETKRNSDFLQVQQEWNESEKVLAYDSMYGARVDYTVNGKWHSELQRGVGGQILHGIIAWMPIPKYV